MDKITYDSRIIKAHLKCNGHVIWISIPRITEVKSVKEETYITINADAILPTSPAKHFAFPFGRKLKMLNTSTPIIAQINKMIEEEK